MADAAQAIAWELEGRTLKVYLDVPLEKRQGLPKLNAMCVISPAALAHAVAL